MKQLLSSLSILSLSLSTGFAGDVDTSTPQEIVPVEARKPFAISVHHLYQESDLAVTGLDFSFINPSPEIIPLIPLLGANPVERVEDTVNVTSAILSWDPVPWLQVFGRLGHVEGESDTILVEPFAPISYTYDGYTYAGGATLSWANDRYFAFVNTQIIESDLGEGSASVWSLDPRAGIILSDRARAYVGASRQDSEQTQTGRLNSPTFGPTDFTIDLVDIVHWNYVAGVQYQLGDLALTFEGGFGHRKHLAAFASVAF